MPCLQGSGSYAEGPANSSSLLFSVTGVNSLINLAFDGLSEGIFSLFMEGNAIHRNLFHAAVIQTVAFTQEIGARLRIGNHRDHPARRTYEAVKTQRADLQTQFARRQIRCALALLPTEQRFKGIPPSLFYFAFRGRRFGPRSCTLFHRLASPFSRGLLGGCLRGRLCRRLACGFAGWFSSLWRGLCRSWCCWLGRLRRGLSRLSHGGLHLVGGCGVHLRAQSGRCRRDQNP